MLYRRVFCRLALGVSASVVAASICPAATIDWVKQYGAENGDASYSVSADGSGNAYIAGSTSSDLAAPHSGSYDGFVASFDSAGNRLWTRQIQSSDTEFATSVSADRLGSIYVGGWTGGDIAAPNAGSDDIFLHKFDSAGNQLWSRQIGTKSIDKLLGVSADGLGSVYATGYTRGSLGGPNAGESDAFVIKYDASGNLIWSRQLGTASYDEAAAISADGIGNIFIAGTTWGTLDDSPFPNGAQDAFLAKYNSAGDLQWTRQLGAPPTIRYPTDKGSGVAADGLGNVYITGTTSNELAGPNAGSSDAFVSKYDSAGDLLWSRQLGTSKSEDSNSISTDGLGNVYISGTTTGAFVGTGLNDEQPFIIKLNSAGDTIWMQQLGSTLDDQSWSVSADGHGSIYFSGWTEGDFGSVSFGHLDAFLGKISEVPEPSVISLWAIANLLAFANWARKRPARTE